jgi:hypothetical protein
MVNPLGCELNINDEWMLMRLADHGVLVMHYGPPALDK